MHQIIANMSWECYLHLFIHLADAFIQSDLQLRNTSDYHKMAINTRSAHYTRFSHHSK